MKAIVNAILEKDNYIILEIQKSNGEFQYYTKIPKYFLAGSPDIKQGDQIEISIFLKKEKKKK
jgi:hypothetical protein